MGSEMSNWIHRLFNPHCPECDKPDMVVDELKTELASLRYERDRLLNYILEKPQHSGTDGILSVDGTDKGEDELKPILPKIVPWHVRRQMLEAEDRVKAQQLADFKKDQEKAISKLESDLKLDIPGDNDVQSQPVKVNE